MPSKRARAATPPPEDLKAGALFSKDRRHRYALWRIWDQDLPKLVVIGLNPSTADETRNDPTIRRCIGFAVREGLGGLVMVNLHTWRSKDPEDLNSPAYRKCYDTALRENQRILKRIAAMHHDGLFVAAWGANLGATMQWNRLDARKWFPNLYCFGLTDAGSPKHPLYLAASTKLMPFPT
jgi:hypothetical protein